MKRCVAPYVPSRFSEAVRGDEAPAIAQSRRGRRQHVKDRQSIGDVFNLDVIGDDIALEPGDECMSKVRIGIGQETILRGRKENMTVHPAYRAQNAGLDCGRFACLANVVRDLSVEKTQTVTSRDAKLCASR